MGNDGMIGPLVVVIGLLGLWALSRGKAGGVLDAITQTGFSTSLQNALGNTPLAPAPQTGIGTTNGVNIPASSGNSSDIGSHQGLVNGVIVTIDKTYAQMTDAEKGAANAFARAIGNVPHA